MIVYPYQHYGKTVDEVMQGFNPDPKVGDEGHVDDHSVIANALFRFPGVAVVAFQNEGGQWSRENPVTREWEPTNVNTMWDACNPKDVVVIAMVEEHPAADGVTDHQDASALDDIILYVVTAGTVGLIRHVTTLQDDLINLRGRISALESAQA